jgi:membrane protease YdiL (CAAX protease family)
MADIWIIFNLAFIYDFGCFEINKPISILSILINLPFLIVLGGLEELGWRGILQPKLEKVVNYLPSVLIVELYGVYGIYRYGL